MGNPQNRLPWHQSKRFFCLEAFREIFDGYTILNNTGVSELFKYPELVSQMEVNGTWADLVVLKRFDFNASLADFF